MYNLRESSLVRPGHALYLSGVELRSPVLLESRKNITKPGARSCSLAETFENGTFDDCFEGKLYLRKSRLPVIIIGEVGEMLGSNQERTRSLLNWERCS